MDPAYLDIYCERAGPGIWAEPLNVLTNLAFLAAAAWLAHRLGARSRIGPTWDLWLLSSLVATIGIGSALWHLFATPLAGLADVLPIALFITLYLGSFLDRVAGLRPVAILIGVLAYLGASVLVGNALPRDLANGSVGYLPALLALAIITAWAWRSRPDLRAELLTALGLFCVSLTARTLDEALCPWSATGTHFIWHLVNAELLRRLVWLLIFDADRRASAPAPS